MTTTDPCIEVLLIEIDYLNVRIKTLESLLKIAQSNVIYHTNGSVVTQEDFSNLVAMYKRTREKAKGPLTNQQNGSTFTESGGKTEQLPR